MHISIYGQPEEIADLVKALEKGERDKIPSEFEEYKALGEKIVKAWENSYPEAHKNG